MAALAQPAPREQQPIRVLREQLALLAQQRLDLLDLLAAGQLALPDSEAPLVTLAHKDAKEILAPPVFLAPLALKDNQAQ
jgi:hypothetical protein